MTFTSGTDFLIVTTLREETTAVSELLEEKQGLASGIVGRILREGSTAKYELAKITERSFSQCLSHFFACHRWEKIKYDHRSLPMRVSHTLWYAANILSMDHTCDWARGV